MQTSDLILGKALAIGLTSLMASASFAQERLPQLILPGVVETSPLPALHHNQSADQSNLSSPASFSPLMERRGRGSTTEIDRFEGAGSGYLPVERQERAHSSDEATENGEKDEERSSKLKRSPTAADIAPATGLRAPIQIAPISAGEALSAVLRRSGDTLEEIMRNAPSLKELELAAERGNIAAMWRLGWMYAQGEGVTRNDLKAFEQFLRLADRYADAPPMQNNTPLIASAFVALGAYHLHGIAGSYLKPNPEVAHQMFEHAATNFRDGDAQYHLARLYIEGVGVEQDKRRAIKWLHLAANKGHAPAQALLGDTLFFGESDRKNRRALGLMWLDMASSNANKDQPWIEAMHVRASASATEEERSMAKVFYHRRFGVYYQE
jgi:uncharacterized protein